MELPQPPVHAPPRAAADARKAYVETYGCQMNVSDGELMQGILAAHGYELAAAAEEADVILVNTCAIREHAEQRVLGRVAQLYQLKRRRPGLIIGVTGCMAQRLGETLLERAPYVDLVMGPDGYRGLPQALAALRPWAHRPDAATGRRGDTAKQPEAETRGHGDAANGPDTTGSGGVVRRELPVLQADAVAPTAAGRVAAAASSGRGVAASRSGVAVAPSLPWRVSGSEGSGAGRLAVLEFQPHEHYEGLEVRRRSGVSAWVPVQRGCDYRCTYCIVPYVRGPEKNREPSKILEEVRRIAAGGTAEVVLLGQTVNSYRHGDWDFARLLRAVARVDGIRRVRFTSPHPNDVTPELVEVMAAEPAVCKQLHLPVQAGHNRTLKRMLRRYTVESYLEKVRLVRDVVPGVALSTDVIVAFPGETEAEYEATLELLREVRYDDAFLYKYSARAGTPATRLPRQEFIAEAEAQARLERVIALHRQIQAEINEGEVGRVEQVLVERLARSPGDVLARTGRNKVVAFPAGPEAVGCFLAVRLTATTGATFTGELLEAARPLLRTG
ncbi:MAG: MiaB/RimO family radical SAM methylthiotransferase [Gemmatimonadetes bacterium]|nr:MiaB/RimO family radical SAM methylthiotransferase [Gemmatimonadota bacterium]